MDRDELLKAAEAARKQAGRSSREVAELLIKAALGFEARAAVLSRETRNAKDRARRRRTSDDG